MKTRIGILIVILALSFIFCSSQQPPKCGKWRWDVKTLTDKDGSALLLTEPVPSAIDQLVMEPSPKILHHNSHADSKLPRFPSENQVVEIVAFVIKAKYEEDDKDLHLVLKSPDSEKTMIGEIPDPNCPDFDEFPTLRELFKKTRKSGNKILDKLNVHAKPVKVKITGVPFWDSEHKNRSKGPGTREIHPILSIVPL
jgi:hypothetical protein